MSKQTFVLVQSEVRSLLCELWHLTRLTQVQLVEALGVADATIKRWENRRIQPSPLALRQIQTVVSDLGQSFSAAIRAGNKQLLAQYFAAR